MTLGEDELGQFCLPKIRPLCQYNCISFSGCPAHTGFQFSLDSGSEILVDQAIVENRGTFLRESNWVLKQIKERPYSVFSTLIHF